MKKTSLYNHHLELRAKIVSFSGFEMPVNYSKGILHEYNVIRNNCGVFDVSHMGQFFIYGDKAYDFLQNMTINNVSKLDNYDAQYSAMCNENGGIIDDLILYKQPKGYFMVVNAGNIDKNLKWLNNNIIDNVIIEDRSMEMSLIAIQGPNTRNFLSKITDADLQIKFYSYINANILGGDILLSRTGYTGELGFELYGSHGDIVRIWEELICLGVEPCGLASRDILRMEMKYCLYGNDINSKINPLEAGLSWIIDFSKTDFIGKDKLLDIKIKGYKQKLVGFIMLEKAIPRSKYSIHLDSNKIGSVTSGTFSPGLSCGIGLGYIDKAHSKIGTKILVKIRDKFIEAKIVKTPFIKNTSLHN